MGQGGGMRSERAAGFAPYCRAAAMPWVAHPYPNHATHKWSCRFNCRPGRPPAIGGAWVLPIGSSVVAPARQP